MSSNSDSFEGNGSTSGSKSSSEESSSNSTSASADVNDSEVNAHFDSGLPLVGKFRKPLDTKTVEPSGSGVIESPGEPSKKTPPRRLRTAESTSSTLDWERIKPLLANPQARKVLVHVPEPSDRISLPPLDSTGFYSKVISLGIGLPIHPFFISILNSYGIGPAQLNPWAWCHMMGVYFVWSDLGFGDPSLNVWHHLYRINPIAHHPQFYYFGRWQKGRETFVKELPSSSGGWRERFFFLDVATGGPGLREEFSDASG